MEKKVLIYHTHGLNTFNDHRTALVQLDNNGLSVSYEMNDKITVRCIRHNDTPR